MQSVNTGKPIAATNLQNRFPAESVGTLSVMNVNGHIDKLQMYYGLSCLKHFFQFKEHVSLNSKVKYQRSMSNTTIDLC